MTTMRALSALPARITAREERRDEFPDFCIFGRRIPALLEERSDKRAGVVCPLVSVIA